MGISRLLSGHKVKLVQTKEGSSMRTTDLLTIIGLALTLPMASAHPQELHKIPFGSTGNTIELTVVNTTGSVLPGATVRVSGVPSWLKFENTEQPVAALRPSEEHPVVFTFSVDRSAPVGEEHPLGFIVATPGGDNWTKEVTLSVAPPKSFELFQNFPNPFNPVTTISYQLSVDSRVSLKVFDLLGREVAILLEEDQVAGYHFTRFDASGLASGAYVFRLVADKPAG